MPRFARTALLAALLAVATQPVLAKGKGKGNAHGQNQLELACPPGLAKKDVPCVPPGQAKKAYRSYEPGDWIGDEDYHLIRYPRRYDLPPLGPGEEYVIIDGRILRVRSETAEVLSIMRAVSAILD